MVRPHHTNREVANVNGDSLPAELDQHSSGDHAAMVGLLEHLARAKSIEFDYRLTKHAVHQATRDFDAPLAESWLKRLEQAGRDVGLRVSAFQEPATNLLRLANPQAPVVMLAQIDEGGPEVILILRSKALKVEVMRFVGEAERFWLSKRDLKDCLGIGSYRESLVCALAVPLTPCAGMGPDARAHDAHVLKAPPHQPAADHDGHGGADDHDHHGPKPFWRLVGLLTPERGDIWVVFLFAVGSGILALATPITVEVLVNFVAFGSVMTPVVIMAAMLGTFLAFSAALQALQTYVVEIIQRRLFVRMTADLSYRLPRISVSSLDHHYGPELVNRFFDVMTLQKGASSLLLGALSLVLTALISMVVLAFYHPYLLGFDIVLLISVAIIVFGLGHGATGTAINESRAKYAVAGWLEELARHPTAFKTHGGGNHALEQADTLARQWLSMRTVHFRVVYRQILSALTLQVLAQTALLGLGGWLVINDQLTLGQLVASELLVGAVVNAFTKMGKHLETYYDVLAGTDKLGHLIDLPLERSGGETHPQLNEPAALAVRDVEFSYNGHPLLQHVNFDVQPGSRVAIVGPSGSGKTTLAELIFGLRTSQHGRIELDGADVRDLRLDVLRQQVAMVSDLMPIDGTIIENVRMGREEFSLLDVRNALAAVGLLDEVSELPQGMHTPLLSTGRPLSGGQLRRLMLARAILGRPRLLLLDETLDGLDRRSRPIVLETIFSPAAPWSLLVVTHSDEIVRLCDRRVVISPEEQDYFEARPLENFALPRLN